MEKEKTSLMKLIDSISDDINYHRNIANIDAYNYATKLKEYATELLKDEENQIIDAFANGYIENKSGQEYYNDKYKK